MERTDGRLEPASVLLFTQDEPTGRSYVAALEDATIPFEWVRTASALRSRLDRADLRRPALVMVVASRQKALPPRELASFVSRLATEGGSDLGSRGTATSALGDSLDAYCSMRALSPRQRTVLELYLVGNNDKEIADSLGCSATTIYEHWRRIAQKAGGAQKSQAVADFHRFLATRSDGVSPRSPSQRAAPDQPVPLTPR